MKTFYVSNVNENYFSEFLAFVPDEGLHKAEINCTKIFVDVIYNRNNFTILLSWENWWIGNFTICFTREKGNVSSECPH